MNKTKKVLDVVSPMLNTWLVALIIITGLVGVLGLLGISLAVTCIMFGCSSSQLIITIIILALLITIGLHSYDEIKWKLRHRKRKVV